jgi:hypothetical protein
MPFFASPSERAQNGLDPVVGVTGAVVVFLVGLAGVELRNRYAMRRTDTARRHARIPRFITRFALRLSFVLAVAGVLINLLIP